MSGGKAEKIERALDAGAALLFGAAAGFGTVKLLTSLTAAAATGVFASAAAFAALRRVPVPERGFDVPEFTPENATFAELDELVLTDADRWQPQPQLQAQPDAGDELLLEDIVAELAPNSRVVRLFDPASMPTVGELNAAIEQHLGDTIGRAAPADASQQLYDALAELRRSLR
jgi:hypothetical protein